jgi:16S rRNA (guanine527-N7)-methyltransferase
VALATNHPFFLIEADHRKAAFLREVKRAVDAPVEVFGARIEHVNVQQTDLVTARGLASVSELLSVAAPLLRPDGRCILLKGPKGQHELTLAHRKWHMKVQQWQSRTHPGGRIFELSEISIAEPVGGYPGR